MIDTKPPVAADSTSHQWLLAAFLDIPEQASVAAATGSIVVHADTTIDVLEVTCGNCRRGYADAAEKPCTGRPQ